MFENTFQLRRCVNIVLATRYLKNCEPFSALLCIWFGCEEQSK